MANGGPPSKHPVAVVALGGHCLLPKGELPTISKQFRAARQVAVQILSLLRAGFSLVLTHGNGPQVGNILIRSELAAGQAYTLPLSAAVAESEGEIGYILQQSLYNEIARAGLRHPVATVLTQVVVDAQDPAFQKPTKPIGPFFTEAQAKRLRRQGMPLAFFDPYGWRRVVPSPRPLEIVEAETVRRLADQRVVVIAAGGGGIPVVRQNGRLGGVDAVIDKDLASACLAKTLDSDCFIILTDVRRVALWYGSPRQRELTAADAASASRWLDEGQFPPGSMGPKMEAAIDFVKSTGRSAIITAPEALDGALAGRDGTRITP